MSDLATDLRNFRLWAWTVSPTFGQNIDRAYLKGMGFGDGGSLQDVLDALVNEIKLAATASNLSAKNYFDAMTQVDLMAAANRSGVPVDQYTGPAILRNNVAAALTDKSGLPNKSSPFLFVALGAMALFMFMQRETTSRHIGSRR